MCIAVVPMSGTGKMTCHFSLSPLFRLLYCTFVLHQNAVEFSTETEIVKQGVLLKKPLVFYTLFPTAYSDYYCLL